MPVIQRDPKASNPKPTMPKQETLLKKLLFIPLFVLAAVIGSIVVGAVVAAPKIWQEERARSAANAAAYAADAPRRAQEARTKAEAEVISFTAKDLFDAYDSNEVATDISLKGKIVQVTGRVQSINKDVFDSIYVNLATPNQFMSAAMHVVKSEEAKMAALRKGQSVVFRCPKMQRWVGSPSGSDCVLVGTG
jgi:hypothetical protein